VKKAAKEHNGTAHFFNGDFKASTQVHQLQDAMATGKYNVFVVQANDGTAVVPQVQKAVQDGIAVVAEFTQVGTNYKTVAPQVSGEVSVVENTVGNGTDLGKLAIKACGTMNPCNVVYLQGDPSLPLDVARTKAVVAKLSTDKSIHLLGKPVGGYTHAMGHKVAQTVLAAHSNVNVIVGSSQAIEGAQTVLESKHLLSKIKLIGNGGSIQAVKAVKAGKWYATFGIPEVKDGYVATKYAIQKLHGKNPPKGTNSASLGPNDGLWTKPVLAKANYESHYRDWASPVTERPQLDNFQEHRRQVPTPALELRAITKRYGMATVLKDVSLSVDRGEIHAAVGENGAGKSTLLRIAAGLVRPDSGDVSIAGQAVRRADPKATIRAGVAIVTQEATSVPARTVLENVYLGSSRTRLRPLMRAMLKPYEKLCEQTGFDLPADALVGDLSVGDQQMVEVLRSLAREPKVLMLDEPTASLDGQRSRKLSTLLRRLSSEGIAVVFVSHRLSEVFDLAQRITVLRDGAVVGTGDAQSETESSLIEKMVGRALKTLYPPKRRAPADAPIVFEARGVSRSPMVKNVSLQVRRGEIVGLAGLVGAGRSEFARCIFGADRLETGKVSIGGIDRRFRPKSVGRSIAAGIAMIPEDRKSGGLVLHRSIADNLVLASLPKMTRLGFIVPRRVKDLASYWMGVSDIRAPGPGFKVEALSGGNQQKVLLSKWLSKAPTMLIADEPTRGVDVGAKAGIHQAIVQAAADGLAVILISSELEEVLGLAHRVVVFRKGSVVEELSGAAMTPRAVMAAAFREDTGGRT
jgi:ABC-type sugar transport system ATPase subunit/ABC-type sugar transport system substrate-binding protein